MKKRSHIAAVLTAAALTIGTAVPAMAQESNHRSCKGFGHLFAEFAQNPEDFEVDGPAGLGISNNARNVVEAFGQTFTPPGSIAAIVHVEQGLYCDPA